MAYSWAVCWLIFIVDFNNGLASKRVVNTCNSYLFIRAIFNCRNFSRLYWWIYRTFVWILWKTNDIFERIKLSRFILRILILNSVYHIKSRANIKILLVSLITLINIASWIIYCIRILIIITAKSSLSIKSLIIIASLSSEICLSAKASLSLPTKSSLSLASKWSLTTSIIKPLPLLAWISLSPILLEFIFKLFCEFLL